MPSKHSITSRQRQDGTEKKYEHRNLNSGAHYVFPCYLPIAKSFTPLTNKVRFPKRNFYTHVVPDLLLSVWLLPFTSENYHK